MNAVDDEVRSQLQAVIQTLDAMVEVRAVWFPQDFAEMRSRLAIQVDALR